MAGVADDKLLEDIMRVEACAEDFLADKQQLIELDRKRNKTRESLRYGLKALTFCIAGKFSRICFLNYVLESTD